MLLSCCRRLNLAKITTNFNTPLLNGRGVLLGWGSASVGADVGKDLPVVPIAIRFRGRNQSYPLVLLMVFVHKGNGRTPTEAENLVWGVGKNE